MSDREIAQRPHGPGGATLPSPPWRVVLRTTARRHRDDLVVVAVTVVFVVVVGAFAIVLTHLAAK